MSVSVELQTLLAATLKADPSVAALIDGIYDRVAQGAFGPRNAYISFGPSDGSDNSAECIFGSEHTFQIDVWSRAPGARECRRIVDAVRRALHERDLSLTQNALVGLYVELWRVFQDPDGLTTHGVVQVTARVEEPLT